MKASEPLVSYSAPGQTKQVEIKPRTLSIPYERTCNCKPTTLNCLTGKEWLKSQIGIWEFNYEKRDVRDKTKHPATYPIALARKCIEVFTHQGELVLDPFVGAGTTLIAAQDCQRNAVGFDLKKEYVDLCYERFDTQLSLLNKTSQVVVHDDAINMDQYICPNTVSLILTSPPYANLLNRKRKNKSMRSDERKNEQYLEIEQYSQNPRDLGAMSVEKYQESLKKIYSKLLPLLKPKAHCVINVPDFWWENQRITLHILVIEALRDIGYEFRNTIIWDRRNIVNRMGIFGYPSNYITMGTTFEYILDFWRPE
jgi:DNA modification methylase